MQYLGGDNRRSLQSSTGSRWLAPICQLVTSQNVICRGPTCGNLRSTPFYTATLIAGAILVQYINVQCSTVVYSRITVNEYITFTEYVQTDLGCGQNISYLQPGSSALKAFLTTCQKAGTVRKTPQRPGTVHVVETADRLIGLRSRWFPRGEEDLAVVLLG